MNKKFIGTGVALVTPFDDRNAIDYNALEKIVNFTIDGGVDYLVVLGTTGESVTINEKEKTDILKTVYESRREKPIVFGIGGNNTQNIIGQLERWDANYYDAILSVCPYYNKPSQKGLVNHFTMIADKSSKPIILYNVPGRTSVNLTAQSTIELSKHPNIIGIKEASGDFSQCVSILRNTDEDFLLISGDDLIALPLIAMGGKGLISVIANGLPVQMNMIIRNALNNNFNEASSMLQKISRLIDLMFKEGNPTGIKALLEILKLGNKTVRPPLMHASNELMKEISAAYEEAGI